MGLPGFSSPIWKVKVKVIARSNVRLSSDLELRPAQTISLIHRVFQAGVFQVGAIAFSVFPLGTVVITPSAVASTLRHTMAPCRQCVPTVYVALTDLVLVFLDYRLFILI